MEHEKSKGKKISSGASPWTSRPYHTRTQREAEGEEQRGDERWREKICLKHEA